MKNRIRTIVITLVFHLLVLGIFTGCEQTIRVTGIQLSETALSMAPRETAAVTATVFPADAHDTSVTWASSDPNVAAVSDSGEITAAGEGTATITAATNDGNFTASCKVTVTAVPVSGIQIDNAADGFWHSDGISGVSELTATVFPWNATNKEVIWTSSDTSVATVSKYGEVTTISDGVTTITATTADGGYTAEVVIKVTTDPRKDVLIVSDEQTISDQTVYYNIYVTSTGKLTLNNVHVIGDVYCYGQLNVSGRITSDIFAYCKGNMRPTSTGDILEITQSCDAFDGTHGIVIFEAGTSYWHLTIQDDALDYAFKHWGKQ